MRVGVGVRVRGVLPKVWGQDRWVGEVIVLVGGEPVSLGRVEGMPLCRAAA